MRDITQEYSSLTEYAVRVLDIVVIFALAHSAALLRLSVPLHTLSNSHLIVTYFCAALALPMLPRFEFRMLSHKHPFAVTFCQMAASLSLIIGVGVLFVSLTQPNHSLSWTWIATWYLLSVPSITFIHLLIRTCMQSLRGHGYNQRRVIIIGYGAAGKELHKRAQHHQWTEYVICGLYDASASICPQSGIEIIRDMHTLPSTIQKHNAHEVWITLALNESSQLRQLHYLLRNSLVDIRWIPDTSAMSLLNHKSGDFLGMAAVELNCPPIRDVHGLLKELFDRIFALCVLIMLTPILITLAIAIKFTSNGPVFFSQPRLGLNGRVFHVYKFRSMQLHAESHQRLTQATRNDPRITPIGRFIRRTSLDELPQFLNVLKGDMSVVGPRPHALPHNDLYKDKLIMYMQRHRVKPGITGWAQINGFRGETDTREKMARRVAYDLHYIKHWSFWMDLKIILWTAFKGWTDRNAF
jgi:putative colanic acid biosynthesis UDP-glucose lipid carrier transferase